MILKKLIGFIAFWIAVGMVLMLLLTHHYLIALIIIGLLLLIGDMCYYGGRGGGPREEIPGTVSGRGNWSTVTMILREFW